MYTSKKIWITLKTQEVSGIAIAARPVVTTEVAVVTVVGTPHVSGLPAATMPAVVAAFVHSKAASTRADLSVAHVLSWTGFYLLTRFV